MKKIISILLLFCVLGLSFADINPVKRIMEIDVGGDVGFVNSYFSLADFLKELVVIDFNDMAEKTKDGLLFNFDADVWSDYNINFGNFFHLGFHVNLDASTRFILSNDIIDFLANGNELDKPINASLAGGADIFATSGFTFGTTVKKFKVRFGSNVFIPLLHIDNARVDCSAVANSDGTNEVKAKALVDFYLPTVVNSNGSFSSFEELFTEDYLNGLFELSSYAGFDLEASAEYPVFDFFDLGVYVKNIPLVPAKLYSKAVIEKDFEMSTTSLLDGFTISSSGDNSVEGEETDLAEIGAYEVFETPMEIARKFEFGAMAAIRPFGEKLLAIRPRIGFAFDDPSQLTIESFKSTIENFGFSFGVNTELNFLWFFHIYADSFYDSAIWTQQVGLGVNIHFVEVTMNFASQGTDFMGSFLGSGLKAQLGVKVGF